MVLATTVTTLFTTVVITPDFMVTIITADMPVLITVMDGMVTEPGEVAAGEVIVGEVVGSMVVASVEVVFTVVDSMAAVMAVDAKSFYGMDPRDKSRGTYLKI
jgi:hypothetical protein